MENTDPLAMRDEKGEARGSEPPKSAPKKVNRAPSRPTIGKLLLVTIGLLVVCDLVARFALAHHDTALNDGIEKQYPPHTYLRDFATRQDYRFINLYTANPVLAATPEYRFDNMGFRLDKRDLRFGGPDHFKHVWMFGGSTTQGDGTRESETIASNLNDMFEKEGSDWRVINLGQGGFSAAQELLLLIELLHAGFRPDAILCYDGINEMPFDGNIAETGAPGWEKRTPKANVLHDIQGGESSAALSVLTVSRWTKIDDAMAALGRKLSHPAASTAASGAAAPDRGGIAHPGSNWDVVARRYLTDLNVIRSTAAFLGVPAFFYFQPVMQYEDHYRLRAYSDYETSKLIPQMANNEFMRREALVKPELAGMREELGQRDIHDVFRGHDGETLYADPRHPNGAGAAIIATRIFRDIRDPTALSKH